MTTDGKDMGNAEARGAAGRGSNPTLVRLGALAVVGGMIATGVVFGGAALIGFVALILCFWSAFAIAASPPPPGIAALLVAFVALMFASVGTLAVPVVNGWLAPVLCPDASQASARVEVTSPYPGRTDATSRLTCQTPSGPEKVPLVKQFGVVAGCFAAVLLLLIGLGAAARRARPGWRLPALWSFGVALACAIGLRLAS